MEALDSIFEFLFKYSREAFARGSIELSESWPWYAAAVLVAAAVVFGMLHQRRVRAVVAWRSRTVLWLLRTLMLALIGFALLRPVLVVPTAAQSRSVVGILLDDSRSMRISEGHRPRAEFVRGSFGSERGNLLAELSRRFDVRLYRFGVTTEPVSDASELSFSSGSTDLAQALHHAADTLTGAPLAALVVVSDGAHNTTSSLDAALRSLRAASVPVHTVGVGREAFERDIEVSPVELADTVLKGTTLSVRVNIRHRGFEGQRVQIVAEDESRIVSTQDLELSGGSGHATAELRIRFDEAGPRRLRFRIPVQPNETISRNNEQETLVYVRNAKERILYFEGEPRFEVKFLRRAVADDDNIDLVTLLRTAENKYYRLGIERPGELEDGFPTRHEDLYPYRALIIGSIEASYFTDTQLQMIADFVGRRGGGLLVLGGRSALTEGGYGQTVLADVLPVVLPAPSQAAFAREVRIQPTESGLIHPVLQVADRETSTAEQWAALPPLTVVNPIREAKPGAATLLHAADPQDPEPLVILAIQRYGRGRVAAFPVRDSWRWRMHRSVPDDDHSHENFWRQMLRWLVESVPDRVSIEPVDRTAIDEPVSIRAEVRDKDYAASGSADVRLSVISPSGRESEMIMDPLATSHGEYRTRFVPREPGLHELRVQARDADGSTSQATGYFTASADAREFHRAELNAALLKRVSRTTGGQYFPSRDASSIVGHIEPRLGGVMTTKRLALWNMPAIFLLILALLCVEWSYRRWRGLV